ncbi:hypothetical protein K503DRAFT_788273 [Rhizopogon vinicolor AM-OR11-026]|uniref:Uncharacterized protein n=1 Tax=Rhizopogon vinicolor AM-OR11-026 TaxID=1314800 RepID=A0A1B7MDQ9_9AGAM|nr:hypothetical protein K503DRAFT_788273 [Rhizopogon vinicolor AM-OR11-026]
MTVRDISFAYTLAVNFPSMRRAWHDKIGCPVDLIAICLPASGVYLVWSGTFTQFWAIGSVRVVWKMETTKLWVASSFGIVTPVDVESGFSEFRISNNMEFFTQSFELRDLWGAGHSTALQLQVSNKEQRLLKCLDIFHISKLQESSLSSEFQSQQNTLAICDRLFSD